MNILNNLEGIPIEHPAYVLLKLIYQSMEKFANFQPFHYYREVNLYADRLAHLTYLSSLGIEILEHPPTTLQMLLSDDCKGIQVIHHYLGSPSYGNSPLL